MRDAPPAPTATNVAVRAVLARYASAYERLDASAVKDIWPTVDERALARAFSDLDAQSIVFDACDLTIAGNVTIDQGSGLASLSPSGSAADPAWVTFAA